MSTQLAAFAIDILAGAAPTGATITFGQGGSYVDGVWVPGTPADPVALPGVIYAITSASGQNALQQMDVPEGLKIEDARILWTRSELVLHTDDAREPIVTYAGDEYAIHKVWQRVEGGYHRALLVKRDAVTYTVEES